MAGENCELMWLRQWMGPVRVNGTPYPTGAAAYDATQSLVGRVQLEFLPERNWQIGAWYDVTVRPYMCAPWDFHTKWNKGHPMPAATYVGRCMQETPGMVRFEGEAWSGWVIKKAVLDRKLRPPKSG